MKQKLINIYVLISAVVAITTTLLEVQPALYFIEFLAPNPGDKYNMVFVLLVTCLLFLLPLVVFLTFTRLFRKTPETIVSTDKTGFFVTRQKSFTSAMVGIPVYINSEKVGVVDNGKTMFFEASIGTFAIHAGSGKQASDEIEVEIAEGEQLRFEMFINTEGLFPKIELVQI